uniref:Uncharacterized protein n=1 Tax=Romanomermis culicivorax TaxID=13658 RepID=A0A915HNV1_ROMCU
MDFLISNRCQLIVSANTANNTLKDLVFFGSLQLLKGYSNRNAAFIATVGKYERKNKEIRFFGIVGEDARSEIGDPSEFGHLMINSLKNSFENIRFWDAEPEELPEVFQSMAVSSCFSWLNGQAHYKGFTQYTDITYPFSTQAIFTDGRVWYFACYQLNTLDLLYNFDEQFKNDVENPVVRLDDYTNRKQEAFDLYSASGKTKMANLCWYDGPYDFYQTFDQKSGQFSDLNDHVLEKCLKFFKLAPKVREDAPILKPFLKVLEVVDKSDEELILKNMQETKDIKYST